MTQLHPSQKPVTFISIGDGLMESNGDLRRSPNPNFPNKSPQVIFPRAANDDQILVAPTLITVPLPANRIKGVYCAGFAFDVDKVLLIRKVKPKWQEGLLNGIGGSVEPYDLSIQHSQQREFYEETGLETDYPNWTQFDTEVFDHAIIHWFFYSEDYPIHNRRQTTKECPEIWGIRQIINGDNSNQLYNLGYLIAKAWCFKNNPSQQIPAYIQ